MPAAIQQPDIEDVTLEQVLAALADPVRLEIVRLAADQPEQACNVFTSRIPKSTASHHWKVLREAGLISQRQAGTQRLNTLRYDELEARFPGLLPAVLDAARQNGESPAMAAEPRRAKHPA